MEALRYDNSPTKATVAGYEALIAQGKIQEEREDLGNNYANLKKTLAINIINWKKNAVN